MHLHDFLGRVHTVLRPRNYLEIGVQHGYSLQRAVYSDIAIGVDPYPLVAATYNQKIFPVTSDVFFENFDDQIPLINLGFIDGLHHFEQALRDFANMECFMARDGVLIFDDVLPRNQEEASREQCPGDWTGDVWKVYPILRERLDLQLTLVNTEPTGTLVVEWSGYDLKVPIDAYERHVAEFMDVDQVPREVLKRLDAIEPERMLEKLAAVRHPIDPISWVS